MGNHRLYPAAGRPHDRLFPMRVFVAYGLPLTGGVRHLCGTWPYTKEKRRMSHAHDSTELSAGTHVPPDLDADACAPGHTSRVLLHRHGRKTPVDGSGSLRRRHVRLGLAAVPTNAVCRLSGQARSALATQASVHTP